MTRVSWTDQAADDLDAIIDIDQFNPAAVLKIGQRLNELDESLAQTSSRGRPVARGLREPTSVSPYILRDEIADDEVHILFIRRRPLA